MAVQASNFLWKFSFAHYRSFFFFNKISSTLLNPQKNNLLSFFFLGQRGKFSIFNLTVFFYTFLQVQVVLRLILSRRATNVLAVCINFLQYLIIRRLLVVNRVTLSCLVWSPGILKNIFVLSDYKTFKQNSNSRFFYKFGLLLVVGYKEDLVIEAKRLNLPIFGALTPYQNFFFDYPLGFDSSLFFDVSIYFQLQNFIGLLKVS